MRLAGRIARLEAASRQTREAQNPALEALLANDAEAARLERQRIELARAHVAAGTDPLADPEYRATLKALFRQFVTAGARPA